MCESFTAWLQTKDQSSWEKLPKHLENVSSRQKTKQGGEFFSFSANINDAVLYLFRFVKNQFKVQFIIN